MAAQLETARGVNIMKQRGGHSAWLAQHKALREMVRVENADFDGKFERLEAADATGRSDETDADDL